MGASPLGAPSGNPGQSANSMSQVRMALDMLQKALPGLPMGSDPHKAVLSFIQSVSKSIPPSAEIPGVQQTGMRDLQQQAQQSAMMQQLMRSMGGGAGGNVPGGGASSPPPGAPM